MQLSQQSATISPITSTSHLSKLSDQIRTWGSEFINLPHLNQFLLASTILLLGLFISAGFLLHRIDALQQKHIHTDQVRSADREVRNRFLSNCKPYNLDWLQSGSESLSKGDIYEELLKWQTKLHSKSNDEIGSVLQSNLEQIAKVKFRWPDFKSNCWSQRASTSICRCDYPSGQFSVGPSNQIPIIILKINCSQT